MKITKRQLRQIISEMTDSASGTLKRSEYGMGAYANATDVEKIKRAITDLSNSVFDAAEDDGIGEYEASAVSAAVTVAVVADALQAANLDRAADLLYRIVEILDKGKPFTIDEAAAARESLTQVLRRIPVPVGKAITIG